MDPGDLRDGAQDEASRAEDEDRDHRADRLIGCSVSVALYAVLSYAGYRTLDGLASATAS